MWSNYQETVFQFAESGSGNACVNAVAGSGKTATGVEMCTRINTFGRYMAFNKHIATELSKKLDYCVECCTYNAFGNRIVRDWFEDRNLPLAKVSERKDANLLRYFVLGNPASGSEDMARYYKNVSGITRLVSLLKNRCCFSVEAALDLLPEIYERHDLEEVDEGLLLDTYNRSLTDLTYISFDDQKFLPLYHKMPIPQSDFLVIDEAQDTCDLEMNLMKQSCVDGRIIIFGDPWQCIYSFKGTTPDAMSVFVSDTGAVELPLSICYRCSRAVVAEAQGIVPHIEPWVGANEGYVGEIKASEFRKNAKPGDMVLCRTTLDLIRSCLEFIREGVPAFVRGREIGDQLLSVIDKLAATAKLTDDTFLGLLEEWYFSQYAKYSATGNEQALLLLQDKYDTIKVLWTGSVVGLTKQIEKLFVSSDTGTSTGGSTDYGIAHMTIHKSKGLQAPNVYLLRRDLIPHPRAKKVQAKKAWMLEEEYRLKYVAITRAQENFYYVV
jgi:superfamily I DNA/RNA helicase